MATPTHPPAGVPFDAEAVPVPLVRVDPDGRVSAANALARELGVAPGRMLSDLAATADKAHLDALLASADASGTVQIAGPEGFVTYELRVRGPVADRTVALLEKRSTPLGGASALDLAPDPVLVVLPWSFQVVHANRAAVDLIGRRPEGGSMVDLFPPDRRDVFRQRLQDGVDHPGRAPMFDLVGARGRLVPVELRSWRVSVGDATRLIFGLRDLRPRQRAEEERERALEHRLDQVRRATVDRLMGEVGGEFRRMVQAVEPHVSTKGQHLVVGGLAFADSLLHVGRSTPRSDLPFDLRAVANAVVQHLRTTLPPRITVATDLPDAPLPMQGDAAEWHAALCELGRWCGDRLRLGGRIEFAAWRVGSTFWFEVRDDAPRSPSEAECRAMFEPFGEVPGGRVGADGLGLAGAAATARHHRVSVTAKGGASRGATFTFQGTLATTTPAGQSSGRRLLLVDDDPTVRNTLRRLLARYWAVEVASTSEEAARVLRARPADLVVCDLNLQQELGSDVCRDLRRLCPDARYVLMSGELMSPELATEFDAVLQKPFSPDLLVRVLSSLDEGAPAAVKRAT